MSLTLARLRKEPTRSSRTDAPLRTVTFAIVNVLAWAGFAAWIVTRPGQLFWRLLTGAFVIAMLAAAIYTGIVVVSRETQRLRRVDRADVLQVAPLAALLVATGATTSETLWLLCLLLGGPLLSLVLILAFWNHRSAVESVGRLSCYVPPRVALLSDALRSLSAHERAGLGCLAGGVGIIGLIAGVVQLVSIGAVWFVVEVVMPALIFVLNLPRLAVARLMGNAAQSPTRRLQFAILDTLATMVPAGIATLLLLFSS
jgi:hypothetical protein